MKISTVLAGLLPFVFLGLCSSPTAAFEVPSQITFGGATEPSVSPDGDWLMYISSGAGICRMPSDGGPIDTLGISGS